MTRLREITLLLCDQCRQGAGGECHTPGCALWMNDAPCFPVVPVDGATHPVQRDIEDFHREVVGIPDSVTPAIRRPELRAELIREEAAETIAAILRGDLIEAIDGLCDILAVTYGAASEFGIDLAPFWDEVHRTNMAKAGGPLRADGKRLKPPGWSPPDIAGILATMTPAGHATGGPS